MAEILLVDDEPDITLLCEKVLNNNGYSVVKVDSGEKCLDHLSKKRPDLVLLDVMMPTMGGWDVCRKIKENEETHDVPVVMFTIRASDDSVERSFEYAGADDHLSKPFRMEELIEIVHRFVK